jgi:hypothetical protein
MRLEKYGGDGEEQLLSDPNDDNIDDLNED